MVITSYLKIFVTLTLPLQICSIDSLTHRGNNLITQSKYGKNIPVISTKPKFTGYMKKETGYNINSEIKQNLFLRLLKFGIGERNGSSDRLGPTRNHKNEKNRRDRRSITSKFFRGKMKLYRAGVLDVPYKDCERFCEMRDEFGNCRIDTKCMKTLTGIDRKSTIHKYKNFI